MIRCSKIADWSAEQIHMLMEDIGFIPLERIDADFTEHEMSLNDAKSLVRMPIGTENLVEMSMRGLAYKNETEEMRPLVTVASMRASGSGIKALIGIEDFYNKSVLFEREVRPYEIVPTARAAILERYALPMGHRMIAPYLRSGFR